MGSLVSKQFHVPCFILLWEFYFLMKCILKINHIMNLKKKIEQICYARVMYLPFYFDILNIVKYYFEP